MYLMIDNSLRYISPADIYNIFYWSTCATFLFLCSFFSFFGWFKFHTLTWLSCSFSRFTSVLFLMNTIDHCSKAFINVFTCFCWYFEIVHIMWFCVFFCFLMCYYTFWEVTFVSNKRDDSIIIAIIVLNFTPFLYLIKWFPISETKNYKCSISLSEKYACYLCKLFLT